jgi:hypothetical protein
LQLPKRTGINLRAETPRPLMVFNKKIGPRRQAVALKRSATDYKAYLRRLPEFF